MQLGHCMWFLTEAVKVAEKAVVGEVKAEAVAVVKADVMKGVASGPEAP